MDRLKNLLPDILGGIGLSMGLLSMFIGPANVEGNLWPTLFWTIPITGVFGGAARWARAPREHRLKKGSKKFTEFYSKWYGLGGDMYIFCDGVEWMAGPQQRKIVESLLAKGKYAHLFLRDNTGLLVNEFRAAGVSVDKIPENVQFRANFSLRLDDGHRVAIVRTDVVAGRANSEVDVFVESRDRHAVLVFEDLFRSINPSTVR